TVGTDPLASARRRAGPTHARPALELPRPRRTPDLGPAGSGGRRGHPHLPRRLADGRPRRPAPAGRPPLRGRPPRPPLGPPLLPAPPREPRRGRRRRRGRPAPARLGGGPLPRRALPPRQPALRREQRRPRPPARRRLHPLDAGLRPPLPPRQRRRVDPPLSVHPDPQLGSPPPVRVSRSQSPARIGKRPPVKRTRSPSHPVTLSPCHLLALDRPRPRHYDPAPAPGPGPGRFVG